MKTPDILTAIEQIASAVTMNYVDGLPPHFHNEKGIKSVFRTFSQHDFDSMSDKAVQDVFFNQNILVYNPDQKAVAFGPALRGLGGGYDRIVTIQGSFNILLPRLMVCLPILDQSLPAGDSGARVCKRGTVRDIAKHAASPTGNALNALDFSS